MRTARLTLASMILLGCGGSSAGDGGAPFDDAGGPPPTTDAGDGDAGAGLRDASAERDASVEEDAGATTGTDAGPACSASLDAGEQTRTVSFAGETRSYALHVPTGLGSASAPLVIDLHGYLEDANRQDGRSGMRAASDAEGFVLVQPEGSGGAQSWNGGACCGTSASQDRDDIGLMRSIVADVSSVLCIDASRVYATGMSNGGFLAHRLACDAADLFAAVAPVAGVLGIDESTCTPSRAISVFQTHGRSDLIVPYAGNILLSYPSVADTMADWRDTNGCTGDPEVESIGSAECKTWSSCRDGVEVQLCGVSGGGHEWPESRFGATDAIWSFFSRHRLP